MTVTHVFGSPKQLSGNEAVGRSMRSADPTIANDPSHDNVNVRLVRPSLRKGLGNFFRKTRHLDGQISRNVVEFGRRFKHGSGETAGRQKPAYRQLATAVVDLWFFVPIVIENVPSARSVPRRARARSALIAGETAVQDALRAAPEQSPDGSLEVVGPGLRAPSRWGYGRV
jgi:hypothetical protein